MDANGRLVEFLGNEFRKGEAIPHIDGKGNTTQIIYLTYDQQKELSIAGYDRNTVMQQFNETYSDVRLEINEAVGKRAHPNGKWKLGGTEGLTYWLLALPLMLPGLMYLKCKTRGDMFILRPRATVDSQTNA